MTNQQLFLENTPAFILFAILIVIFLFWRIKPVEFRKIPWSHFCIAAALFWGSLTLIFVLIGWDLYYSHFTPHYFRYLAPLASIFIYPLWSLAFRWIAFRLPANPIVSFCILGGLQSFYEHAVAIYRLNLLEVPLLEGTTPVAIFIFAFFEYVVYWGIVVLITLVVGRIRYRQWLFSESNSANAT